MKKTIEKSIFDSMLMFNACKGGMVCVSTSTEIRNLCNRFEDRNIKLSSLSSTLNKMVKSGKILRIENYSSRSGLPVYGYCVPYTYYKELGSNPYVLYKDPK